MNVLKKKLVIEKMTNDKTNGNHDFDPFIKK